MRKIVNGKVYDTETATLVYSGVFGALNVRRDYYVTKKGTYFCHYFSVGKIEVCSEDFIASILAERDVDKYIELFGAVEEG